MADEAPGKCSKAPEDIEERANKKFMERRKTEMNFMENCDILGDCCGIVSSERSPMFLWVTKCLKRWNFFRWNMQGHKNIICEFFAMLR